MLILYSLASYHPTSVDTAPTQRSFFNARAMPVMGNRQGFEMRIRKVIKGRAQVGSNHRGSAIIES